LEEQLQKMVADKQLPDVLTFAGNGEPTSHPHFAEIIDDTIRLRDQYCPQAKVCVLSNATMTHRPQVHDALMRVDDNILKLDTVNPTYINNVDRPQGHYDVEEQIKCLALFKGKCIIQTMLMKGEYEGHNLDNTTEQYIAPYIEALGRIKPRAVMLYTLDRETPVSGLEKADPEVMEAIATRIRALGIEVSVSY
jgi:wyosine [tRNA(Phe)-imidazoG37] synthetase (radical SAM superfamily)